jgi:hypothetical protein
MKEKVANNLGNFDEGVFHIIIENQLKNRNKIS